VLCAGHSLGAAMATLCGPWAKAVFPNVRPGPLMPQPLRYGSMSTQGLLHGLDLPLQRFLGCGG